MHPCNLTTCYFCKIILKWLTEERFNAESSVFIWAVIVENCFLENSDMQFWCCTIAFRHLTLVKMTIPQL